MKKIKCHGHVHTHEEAVTSDLIMFVQLKNVVNLTLNLRGR